VQQWCTVRVGASWLIMWQSAKLRRAPAVAGMVGAMMGACLQLLLLLPPLPRASLGHLLLPDISALALHLSCSSSPSASSRFADRIDCGCMLLGLLGAVANGAAMPMFSILFGDL
jgi:hypothetical protein